MPPGEFLTGAIHLLSNVNLQVSAGATIKFSREPKQYLPLVFTRWEGVELMNYSPFIYAFAQRNIAVTGDDCIAIKSGRNDAGRRVNAPTENVVIHWKNRRVRAAWRYERQSEA